jgi:hypothetical protein
VTLARITTFQSVPAKIGAQNKKYNENKAHTRRLGRYGARWEKLRDY